MNKICKICGKEFETNLKHGTLCSNSCRTENIKRKNAQKILDRANNISNSFDDTAIDGYDYLTCPICKQKVYGFSSKHVKSHGFSNIKEFLDKFNFKTSKCEKTCEKSKGDKNPGYQHGGKLSPWSEKSNFSKEQIIESKRKAKENRKPENNSICLEYWLAKGFSQEEAIKKQAERQTTFSKEICIKKLGEEEGLKRWTERQEKWEESIKNTTMFRTSTVSTECFSALETKFTKKLYYGDEEKVIRLDSGKIVRVDCFDETQNKIIEFYGDYWHGNPNRFSESDKITRKDITAGEVWKKDADRTKLLEQKGYKVMIVWENDYCKDKEGIVQKCLKFLQE